MDRLLFVDDEQFVLSALRRLFEPAGFEVVTALGAEEGLKALAERSPFQVICSDYRMPGLNGAAFLERARAAEPDAFRVLLSAFAEFEAAVQSINRGEIHRFLTKPWDNQEFLEIVRDACAVVNLRRRYAELTPLVHARNEELEHLNQNLERLLADRTSNLLEGLVGALDQRDTETQWHARRVALFAKLVAERLGVSGQELVDIEQGALLHDLGKLGVSEAILRKPGPLTPDEWTQMKQHPERGFQMLRNVPFLQRVRMIVLQHQEHFDGSGYPQGLAGKQIVLGARIFAVADALEAITSDRPYREARSHALAREEIVRCAASQFDPDVVQAFSTLPEAAFTAVRDHIRRLEEDDEQRLARDALLILSGSVVAPSA